jgi:hypothetical protein
MAPTPVKLVALAAATGTAVVISFFSRYRCRHHATPFAPHGVHRVIVVSNEQEVGEEMDLADGNVQLLCHGFSENNYNHFVWSQRDSIPNGAADAARRARRRGVRGAVLVPRREPVLGARRSGVREPRPRQPLLLRAHRSGSGRTEASKSSARRRAMPP